MPPQTDAELGLGKIKENIKEQGLFSKAAFKRDEAIQNASLSAMLFMLIAKQRLRGYRKPITFLFV
ncbi:hypothetical protein ACP8HI_21495 [Paenibacillus sp. FA6]|uniref:hypothetical protein n=1 Tax=Paenibacillus sp. FA6 TaxID=3413029 RepID=UPI003F6605CC